MIARHDNHTDSKVNLWAALAAPLAAGSTAWRQDGRATARDGRWYARFVAYVDANTVRERLDAIVPGEWDLTLELLPAIPGIDDDGQSCSFKARLQILGVIREDVGTGRDYKQAATDAFKRAAVRFGIAHELYQLDQNWVQVDGDGRYAKPLEDPQAAYDRRAARRDDDVRYIATQIAPVDPFDPEPTVPASARTADAEPVSNADAVRCPKCGGRVWDNRLSKRNPKAPDFKCRDRNCDGVIWPPRDGKTRTPSPAAGGADDEPEAMAFDSSPLGASIDEEIPF